MAICLQKKFVDQHPSRRCADCESPIDQITRFAVVPKILVFAINHEYVKFSKKISFHDGMVTGKRCKYEGRLNTFLDSDSLTCPLVMARYYPWLYMLKSNVKL